MVEDNDDKEPTVEETPVEQEKLYHLHGGLVERPDGTLEKSKMMDVFGVPLDDYSDIRLTQSEMRRVRWHGEKLKYGFQAMAPITCLGPVRCPFKLKCPIIDKNIKMPNGETNFSGQNIRKFPLARACPIENDFLVWKRQAYLDEFDADIESPTELGLINKLAELDLYDYRITLVLGSGDHEGEGMDLMKNQITGATTTGDVITRLEEHPAVALKDKLHKQRMEILDSLVGTRHAKYKREAALKQKLTKDPSSTQSDLKTRLEKLNNEAAVDVEFQKATPEKEK